jgi:hypothetical protein
MSLAALICPVLAQVSGTDSVYDVRPQITVT